MSDLLDDHEKVESELDGLLLLAETSTQALDQLSDRSRQTQFRTMYGLSICYGGLAMLVAATTFGGQVFGLGVDFPGSRLLLVGAGAIAMIVGAFMVVSALQGKARLSRELRTERQVQMRLVSMIEDQFVRVRHLRTLSPVALATIEIRLARLDRGSYKRGSPT